MIRTSLVSVAVALLMACSAQEQSATPTGATTVEPLAPASESTAHLEGSALASSAASASPDSARAASSVALTRQQQLSDALAKLDVLVMDSLSGRMNTTDVLQPGADFDIVLKGQASTGNLTVGGGGGGEMRIGTGTSSAAINGKAPKDTTEPDVDKAIRDAGCTPTLQPNKKPLSVFEVSCGERGYEVTLVPPSAKLADGQRAALTKDAAVFEEGGVLLVVRATKGTDLDRARVLLRKLQGDTKAGVPTGSVAVGGASVSGGVVGNAAAVVAGMAAGFRRCYNRGLQEDGAMQGSLKLSLVLGPSGEVQTSTASDVSAALSATVVGCVKARGASAQFSSPEGGAATITVPLTFSSKSTMP